MLTPTENQLAILRALLTGSKLTRHLDGAPRLDGRPVAQAAVSGLYQRGLLRSRSSWPTTTYTLTLAGARLARPRKD